LGWGLKVVSRLPWGALSGVPLGAGSREYVLGTLWWFLCPSVPIHTIHADTDNIPAYTDISMHIPIVYTLGRKQNTYCSIIPDTVRFLQIHVNTKIYLLP
jgi:hypothetical protein